MHLAAPSGSLSLLSLLDPLPVYVIAPHSDGCTSPHLAANAMKYDVVQVLALRAIGRVRARVRWGSTNCCGVCLCAQFFFLLLLLAFFCSQCLHAVALPAHVIGCGLEARFFIMEFDQRFYSPA